MNVQSRQFPNSPSTVSANRRVLRSRLTADVLEAVSRPYDVLPLGEHTWQARSCRYPLWDDKERPSGVFCGEPVRTESSYCAWHHALCHAPEDMDY